MRSDGRTGKQTDRQSDRHDEANSGFAQFCELAYKPEMYNISENEQELPQSSNVSVFPFLPYFFSFYAVVRTKKERQKKFIILPQTP